MGDQLTLFDLGDVEQKPKRKKLVSYADSSHKLQGNSAGVVTDNKEMIIRFARQFPDSIASMTCKENGWLVADIV